MKLLQNDISDAGTSYNKYSWDIFSDVNKRQNRGWGHTWMTVSTEQVSPAPKDREHDEKIRSDWRNKNTVNYYCF